MNDTPRTDEAQFGTGRVSVDFARQLERELNYCQKRLAQVNEEYETFERTTDSEATHWANLLHAANERIANLEAGSIHSCHDQCQRTACVLRRKLAEVEKERDEYKYVAATLDDLYVAGQHRIAELEQELAVSKSQFEAMALSFTDKWRRLAELERAAVSQGWRDNPDRMGS